MNRREPQVRPAQPSGRRRRSTAGKLNDFTTVKCALLAESAAIRHLRRASRSTTPTAGVPARLGCFDRNGSRPVHHEPDLFFRKNPRDHPARPRRCPATTKKAAQWRAEPMHAVRGDAPRGHRTALHRQVLGSLGRRHLPVRGLRAQRCSIPAAKFDAGCGWPSFSQERDVRRRQVVERVRDRSAHGMTRI